MSLFDYNQFCLSLFFRVWYGWKVGKQVWFFSGVALIVFCKNDFKLPGKKSIAQDKAVLMQAFELKVTFGQSVRLVNLI